MPETAQTADRLDDALKALASAPRRELLRIVSSRTAGAQCCGGEDEVCACELADALALAPSTISHHMNALVRAGLVHATRKGLWVYYRVDREALARVAAAIVGL
jgi:ArsR family transcriptional regulator